MTDDTPGVLPDFSHQLDELLKAWRGAQDFERQQFVVTCYDDLLGTIEACYHMMKLPERIGRER